jgi:hypothetical protein
LGIAATPTGIQYADLGGHFHFILSACRTHMPAILLAAELLERLLVAISRRIYRRVAATGRDCATAVYSMRGSRHWQVTWKL